LTKEAAVPLRKLYEDYDEAERLGPDTGRLHTETSLLDGETPHERHGGSSFAGAFFGWLVAIASTVLLAGIVGAGATAAGRSPNVAQSQAEQQAGTVGLASAVALLVSVLVAYYAGGYVAGRMSRFDGGRQGLGVWLLGLLVMARVAVLGAVFRTEYDVFQRVGLPAVPFPTDTWTIGGVVALVAVVLGTLMFAIRGGKAGQRYHAEIDRAA
jgi:hypothetical protein